MMWRNRLGPITLYNYTFRVTNLKFIFFFKRWAALDPERIALVWEKDEPGDTVKVTYAQLKTMVAKIANLLKQVFFVPFSFNILYPAPPPHPLKND